MPQVTIYTTSTCPHCLSAKNFLRQEGIAFTEKDVSRDPGAQREMAAMGARGVPTFKIDETVIVGFDRDRIKALAGGLVVECPRCRTRLRLPAGKGTLKVTCNSCRHTFKVKT